MSAKKTTHTSSKGKGFSAEEKAAMKERARELKSKDGKADLLAKIAEMKEPDRSLAKKLHAVITEAAPSLTPTTWYGMPAYSREDKVVCFFQPAAKFKARYSTLGFNEMAKLDDGDMWATSFAINKLTPEVESKIAKLVKKAAG
jgi:uncharacterized protein YdhG (YjbR/CyaY superfamily)